MFVRLHYKDAVLSPVPFSDLPGSYLALVTEIEEFYSSLLGFEMTRLHPQFLYKELYQLMDSMLLYEEAVELVDKVDLLAQRLEIVVTDKKPSKSIQETAPILHSLRGILGVGNRVRRWHQGFTPRGLQDVLA